MVNVQGGRCWDTRAAVILNWRGYGYLCLGEESWIQVENVGRRRTLALGRASPLSYAHAASTAAVSSHQLYEPRQTTRATDKLLAVSSRPHTWDGLASRPSHGLVIAQLQHTQALGAAQKGHFRVRHFKPMSTYPVHC